MKLCEHEDPAWAMMRFNWDMGIPLFPVGELSPIGNTYDLLQHEKSQSERNRKMIRLQFCDFADFDHIKTKLRRDILSMRYVLDERSPPDFLICGGLGFEHLKYDCVKIAFLSENIVPDFNYYDYAIGFNHISFEDRYFRMPLFPMYDTYKLLKRRVNEVDRSLLDRKFCSFVVSNGEHSDPIRRKFFEELSKYKKVDSGGAFLNNIGGRILNKIDFCRQYKFNISFENSSVSGYTTEKIMQAYAAQTVPIYWGNPSIEEDFRIASMIRISDEEDINRAIEEIIRLDQDDDAYLALLAQECLVNDFDYYENNLATFLYDIIDGGPKNKRCCKYGGQAILRKHMTWPLKMECVINSQVNFLMTNLSKVRRFFMGRSVV